MNEKRELPILNGKLLSDLDANGHKIIGVDIEFSPEKIKEAIAPELEAKADKREVANKADTEDVWLRGNDATSDTNFAHSIKVNVISALGDESGIMFNSPITTSEVTDDYGTTQNLTIEHNEISAHFTEEEDGWINRGTIVLNGSVELRNGGLYSYDSPIMASSFESYMYYVSSGGALVFTSYDEFGFTYETTLDALAVENLSSNSWYVQENLRGHITHDVVYDEWDGGTYGTITITPVTYTDWGDESSDFYFSSNGNLTMSGTFRCYGSDGSGGGVMADWISCTYDVSCSSVWAAYGVDVRSRTDEWGGEYGGFIVRDEYDYDVVSSLLGGTLRIGDKNYSDCVEITVATGDLSLLFCHQDEELTFSFSDFATLRTMIDEYNASKGA